MKPDPDKWYIGPYDESFEYYRSLTDAISSAKSAGMSEDDREIRILHKLRDNYQRKVIRSIYAESWCDPVDYGLPSKEEAFKNFQGKPWKEVIDWALQNWNENSAKEACRFKK